jgi:hypothetical protein
MKTFPKCIAVWLDSGRDTLFVWPDNHDSDADVSMGKRVQQLIKQVLRLNCRVSPIEKTMQTGVDGDRNALLYSALVQHLLFRTRWIVVQSDMLDSPLYLPVHTAKQIFDPNSNSSDGSAIGIQIINITIINNFTQGEFVINFNFLLIR